MKTYEIVRLQERYKGDGSAGSGGGKREEVRQIHSKDTVSLSGTSVNPGKSGTHL
jgi:hypothetical protein